MRLHRFFYTKPLTEKVLITDEKLLHQWKHVFRYEAGDKVILFGDGNEHTYTIEHIEKKDAELSLIVVTLSLKHEKEVHAYIALPKKEAFELIVEKLCELGVTDIHPLIANRSEKKEINEERTLKILVEAVEQSGWGSVPRLHETETFEKAVARFKEAKVVVFDTETENIFDSKNVLGFCIGPEGGWSEEEREIFEKNGVLVASLGKGVLRAETAAIVAAGLFSL